MSRILVADPDPTLRKALGMLLIARQPQIEFRAVDNPVDLYQEMAEFCPHVVILDWNLFARDTEISFKHLREQCSNLSIIVMCVNEDIMPLALQLGADDFLPKSSSPEQVLNLLRHYLSLTVN